MSRHEAAVRAFWAWWATSRPAFEAAIATGEYGALVGEAATHVEAIDGRLQWELGKGRGAAHFFALSANGDPVLRRLTERWKVLGPANDDSWEYWSSRPPRPNATLVWGSHPLRLDAAVLTWTTNHLREVLDITICHPEFARMSEDDRESAAVLLLDGALGEDDVERWVGSVDVVSKAPIGAQSLAVFLGALEKMVDGATGNVLVTLESDGVDGPKVIVYNAALKQVDHLDLDLHLTLTLKLLQPNTNGLATETETTRLDALERELGQALGERAVWLGRETCAGKRLAHFFAAESVGLREVCDRWMREHHVLRPHLISRKDEAWDAALQWNGGDGAE
ncbi:MAG: DUF695 domain-containing protein [Myxococcales bacterium]|nr:DUF695 domain-containing protein [Myxococcales bacterium]